MVHAAQLAKLSVVTHSTKQILEQNVYVSDMLLQICPVH